VTGRKEAFKNGLIFQLSSLVHFLVRQANHLLAEFPHFSSGLGIPNGIGIFVLEDFSSGSSGSSGLSIWAPESNGLGASVPAPINARLGTLWIINALGKALSGFFLADVSSSDILHEERENLFLFDEEKK
jgi:hypothetical protein